MKITSPTLPPTMLDIAKAAGVSPSIVSKALNGSGAIPLGTREKVLHAAQKLGYQPNRFAPGLRAYRNQQSTRGWPVAVFVTPRPDGAWYPNEPLLAGLRERVQAGGFTIEEHSLHDFDDLPEITKVFFAGGVRGIVMHSQTAIENVAVDWSRFCVVTCARWEAPSRFHTVRSDVFSGIIRLWKELENNGYEDIGVAACRHTVAVLDDFEREGAVHAMQARLPKSTRRIPVFLGGHGDIDGFLTWFKEYRPRAVIGFNDLHYRALKEAGYRIPDDCAYASIERTELVGEVAGNAEPQLTMGKKILRLMDSLIRHNETGIPGDPETLLVRPVFQPGTSLRAAPSA